MPGAISDARPEPGQGHDAGDIGAEQDAADHRQEGQPAGHRAVSLDLLQVVREEQEDAEDRDPREDDRDIGAAPGAVEYHAQRQQRVTAPPLGDNERGEEHHAEDQGADRQPGRPAGGLGVGEAEDDEEEPGAGQDGPGPVHPRRVAGRLLRMYARAPATAIAANTRLT